MGTTTQQWRMTLTVHQSIRKLLNKLRFAFLVLNHILKNKSLFSEKPEEKHSLSNLTRTLKGQSTFLGILLMDSNCFAIFVQQHSSYVCSDIYYY